MADTVNEKTKDIYENAASSDTIKELKEALEKNEAKIQVSPGPLQWLKAVNNWLEGLPTTITKAFKVFFGSGEKMSQTGVDMICRWLAWKVNLAVERKRQQVVKSLYEQYGFMYTIQKKITVVKEMLTNPLSILGAVAGAVKTILNFFFGPFAFVIQFIIDIFKELARLAKNMQSIASALPPSPPNPSINFNEFKINIGKMGASILTEDPSNLPAPEEMFPEPIRPFSSKYWEALGDEAKQVYREEKPFYYYTKNKQQSSTLADSDSSIA